MTNDFQVHSLKTEIVALRQLCDFGFREKDKTISMLTKQVENLQENLAESNRLLIQSSSRDGLINNNLIQMDRLMTNNPASEGDTFNVSQAGAVGRYARSDNNTFFQSEDRRTLAEAATEIQSLLKQLDQNNPIATETEKIAYINDETTPSFKRRVVGSLQASGETAIDEFILENKYLKVVKSAIKGWLQPDN